MANPAWTFALSGQGSDTLEIDIYDDIGESFCGESVSAKDVRAALKGAPNAKTIRVRVNSRGGDVFDGFAIYNLLAEHPARVEAQVDALAASMASVVIMAADEIKIAAGAMIMIHNPWAFTMGEGDDLRATADLLDKMRDQIADVYVARTGIDRDRVVQMMNDETWLNADEAKEHGFADVIAIPKSDERKKALASIRLDGLKPPKSMIAAVAHAREGAPKITARTPAEPPAQTNITAAGGTPAPEKATMKTLEELRAQHPDVYAAAFAMADKRVADAIAEERDRVAAHLTMGEASGDMATALNAVKSGDKMTSAISAAYMAAGMKRGAINARQDDSNAAGNALDGAAPAKSEPTATDAGDVLVAALKSKQVIA